jgi:hypothetical protein
VAEFTYRNNYGYGRQFSDILGKTLTLEPYEEVTFEQAVNHPNLEPVNDAAVTAAGEAVKEAEAPSVDLAAEAKKIADESAPFTGSQAVRAREAE